jgi:hypothetical protein
MFATSATSQNPWKKKQAQVGSPEKIKNGIKKI